MQSMQYTLYSPLHSACNAQCMDALSHGVGRCSEEVIKGGIHLHFRPSFWTPGDQVPDPRERGMVQSIAEHGIHPSQSFALRMLRAVQECSLLG